MAPTTAIDEMMKNSTPEMQKAGMDRWMQWMQSMKGSMVDMGTPLGKNMRVNKTSATETRNEVCGYSILQADSLAAAADLCKGSPHFEIPGGYIDVLECMSMPGM